MKKDSLWWLFADTFVPAILIALWSPPLFALFQLSEGNSLIGVSILIVWVPIFTWVVTMCHRRQIVRMWLALGSTAVVLIIFGIMILRLT
ncbi:MAG: hypothetical protein OJF51_001608 [Nitrospira sp.]|jgi:hypothetical protein|nr:MAG: hypothetical protein OJF51_001608 [Nitrospira sp.]